MSQQGSDIPFIKVEAEVVHCSFGSINLCYAVEGDSQGEVGGLRFHVRVGGTFDTKRRVRDSYCRAAGVVLLFSSQRKPKYSKGKCLSARNIQNMSLDLYHFELSGILPFYF